MTDPRCPAPTAKWCEGRCQGGVYHGITISLLRGLGLARPHTAAASVSILLYAAKPAGEDGYFFINVIQYRLLASWELLLCNEAFHVQCYSLTVHELGTQLAVQLGLN